MTSRHRFLLQNIQVIELSGRVLQPLGGTNMHTELSGGFGVNIADQDGKIAAVVHYELKAEGTRPGESSPAFDAVCKLGSSWLLEGVARDDAQAVAEVDAPDEMVPTLHVLARQHLVELLWKFGARADKWPFSSKKDAVVIDNRKLAGKTASSSATRVKAKRGRLRK